MFSPFQRVWSYTGSGIIWASEQAQIETGSATSEATEHAPSSTSIRSSFDIVPAPPTTPWMRELQPVGSSRHSRASSVVSTRTKYSTMTLQDDARSIASIDIHVGGQTFRISRDGSRITDDAPPPYNGPMDMHLLRDGRPRANSQSNTSMRELRNASGNRMSFRGGRPSGSSVFDHYYGESEDGQTDQGVETPRQHSPVPTLERRDGGVVTDGSEASSSSRPDRNSQRLSAGNDDSETPSRNWSYKAGPDVISIAPEARKLRSVSQNDIPLLGNQKRSPLMRRNGVRLPTIITESLDDTQRLGSMSEAPTAYGKRAQSPPTVRSAGPVLYTSRADRPESPSFIGRHARGVFPAIPAGPRPRPSSPIPESSSSSDDVDHDSDGTEGTAVPPSMDNENDISLHYARLMRTLDRDHRKALHLKDKELEKLRDRLNEVDTVYRQELKFRDFVIDDLKKRLENLEDKSETMVEKARNEVEDLWERRWKSQSSKLTERMRRMEEEVQKSIDRNTMHGAGDGDGHLTS